MTVNSVKSRIKKDQTMSNIIKQLEQEQLKQNVPSFRPGDTLE